MHPKKEIWLFYLLVTLATVVIVSAENPASSAHPPKWIKCTKLNVPACMQGLPSPHPFITDAIFRNKV